MNMLKAFMASFNLTEFVASKKAKAMMLTVIGVIAGWFSLDLPEDVKANAAGAVLLSITATVGIYLHAQGKSDAGSKGGEEAKAKNGKGE